MVKRRQSISPKLIVEGFEALSRHFDEMLIPFNELGKLNLAAFQFGHTDRRATNEELKLRTQTKSTNE